MTSLKTKNICFLAAFLFLAIVPTLTKVVQSASECKGYERTPPEIPGILEDGKNKNQNRYKIICQTYGDDPKSNQRYLTVYDIVNRIPVFSAYEYKGSAGDRSGIPWKIEPQLDEQPSQKNGNMKEEDSNINYNDQAVNADYDGNGLGYDKGHLFPVKHASSQDEVESTFTLTNAVPQHHNFNGGRWRVMEGNIKNEMEEQKVKDNNFRCFVVVGAQPSDNNIAKNKLNDRVNIPKVMWSAFYCTNGESGAYWDDNIKRDRPPPMERKTLQQLQDKLDDLTIDPTLKGITVFPQPGQKRSSSDSQQPQAGPSKQPRKSRSPSSSARNP